VHQLHKFKFIVSLTHYESITISFAIIIFTK